MRKQPKTRVNDALLLPQAAALASGMMDKLGRPGHYTLFAPTNDAFQDMNPGHLERLMGDKDVIAGILDALTAHESCDGSGANCVWVWKALCVRNTLNGLYALR